VKFGIAWYAPGGGRFCAVTLATVTIIASGPNIASMTNRTNVRFEYIAATAPPVGYSLTARELEKIAFDLD
jgi:hypothetical protein